ncbi:S8 family peptidase [Lacrimispora celerecrescens]|uniref:Peptidase S8 n=1 Tax=Lacrimispora celerecrescens TaxID=29354 RepID=A0A084JLK4_9FIRM|nr:S8 family peptidase [Lacrimispora celerecrescens]KEZ89838.1 peptidase S8 [Lacrimispora celerecrescens]
MEKILDNRYYDLIISNAMVPSYNTGDNITTLNEMNSLLHIPKDQMEPCDLGVTPYHSFPTLYTLESSVSIEKSGIGAVQRTPGLGLIGRGVIVGIVDTGIDYRHPAFKYNDKTTRILSIWDQTQVGSTPPRGFTFGAEYTRELINFALISENPFLIVPTVDTIRHGTAIASIIAGRPNEAYNFSGVVPEADLLVVKLKTAKDNLKKLFFVPDSALCYQESDIILGIRYLVTTAQRLNRPLVICIALGSSQGGHDGRGASSAYLDYLVQLPKIGVTIAAGNEGNSRRHYFNNTQTAPYVNNFRLNVGINDKGFSMEIWPYIPSKLYIEITAPTWETSQIIYPAFSDCKKIVFQSVETVAWVNNIIFEEETGDQLILVRFQNIVPGTWYFRVGSTENEAFSYHAWLPSGNIISNETFFLDANPDTTITSQGDAVHPLTVTAYNQLDGNILSESSRGYTRLGLIKPDLGSPGYQIPCALPDFQYGSATGTGVAAAHAAGVAAMTLEWAYNKGNFTSITGYQVNRLMIRGARRDPTNIYPNNVWGYGQLDAENMFRQLTTS